MKSCVRRPDDRGRWLGLALFLALGNAASAFEYRGFTVDESRLGNSPQLPRIEAAIKGQVDIVLAVGLPDSIVEFFRGVPLKLVPAEAIASGTPGLYSGTTRTVDVTSKVTTIGHKPVLLHELLHAYHHQRMPDGFRNRDISAFYGDARSAGLYEARSHMMQNDKEYFACAATTYLFGATAQEPFKRETLTIRQPKFVEFLHSLFGSASGCYQGSLN